MREDSQGSTSNAEVEKEKFDWHWVKLAIFDVNTLLLSLIFFFIITPIYSFSLFLPTINSTFGYSRVVAQLLTVSPSPPILLWARNDADDITAGPAKHRRLLLRPRHLLALRPLQASRDFHARRVFSHIDRLHNADLYFEKFGAVWRDVLCEFFSQPQIPSLRFSLFNLFIMAVRLANPLLPTHRSQQESSPAAP